ncbi:MAG TPA: ammonia channel protein [Verrucomicrobiales bacterium]|jgi:Amt family ammonium transporter|nr:ammonia channel protein [Verrucomicrobiales bacterium]HCI92135.1 ammonia channel protein [Verrucomicrobiales bacterium]HCL96427.1 ammonia channel protein [Verrucomicrobiales bacterium]
MKQSKTLWLMPFLLIMSAPLLMAAEETSELNSGDTAWMLVASLLVLLMCLPGLALFYGGLVRGKNVLSIFVQCFAIAGVMSILWVIFGYAIATGDSWHGLIGWDSSKLFLDHISSTEDGNGPLSGTIPESVFVMFQMTFIIISPALIVGAFAERMKFSAILIFTIIWTLLSYLPMWHMVWGGGLLHSWGAIDFAGGNVVHINAGIAGLVACIFLGKRRGYPGPALVPHNVPFVLIGAALLWVGWFGFNAGSQLAADTGAGMAMLTTQVATAAAVVVWIALEWIIAKKPTAVGAATGAVAGLVAITPAAGTAGIMGALVIGALSSLVCYFAATKLKHALGYDDSLDVFGVHGIGGIVGALLTGWFIRDGSGDFAQVIVQGKSIVVTVLWSAVASIIGLYAAKLICGDIRVEEDVEHGGLDRAEHGEEAYNWEA